MAKQVSIKVVMEKLGGRPAAAVALGISQQAIQKWVNNGRVPLDRVVEVEALTGIPRQKLRPDLADIFGPAPSALERKAS